MTSFSTLTRTLSRGLSRRHALRSVCLAATVVAGLAPATGALAQTQFAKFDGGPKLKASDFSIGEYSIV